MRAIAFAILSYTIFYMGYAVVNTNNKHRDLRNYVGGVMILISIILFVASIIFIVLGI